MKGIEYNTDMILRFQYLALDLVNTQAMITLNSEAKIGATVTQAVRDQYRVIHLIQDDDVSAQAWNKFDDDKPTKIMQNISVILQAWQLVKNLTEADPNYQDKLDMMTNFPWLSPEFPDDMTNITLVNV